MAESKPASDEDESRKGALAHPVPEQMPKIVFRRQVDLQRSIWGMCSESMLSRAEIIGSLETVKHQLLARWLQEADAANDEDEDDACPS